MKSLNTSIAATALAFVNLVPSFAVAQSSPGGSGVGETKKQQAAEAVEMTDGEVRKVDKDAKKITIRHGTIKNLDMPPMTMVFQARDAAMLEKVQKGDKVKFKAIMSGSAMVITEIYPVK